MVAEEIRMTKKVMVVDDNPDIILAVKSGLEQYQGEYEVIGAESGKRCLHLLETNKPDLILLDIMMPEMSGWETFDRIKGSPVWGNIPVVFLTARTDRVARNAGGFLAEDYIEKPFEIIDLKNRIDKVIEK